MAVLLTILVLALQFIQSKAFSSEAPQQSPPARQFIEISKAASLPNDRLPASFVTNWPTWVLDPHAETDKWIRIPDASAETAEGFVSPTSIDELWQPMDLKFPTCRLAVGLHVRDGTIRHVLPAVDLTLNNQHRNRGLCSVPLAYQWMDFGSLALAGGLEACKLVLQSRDDTESTWNTLEVVDSIKETIDLAVSSLVDDPPVELGEGSSIIHVLFNKKNDAYDHTVPKIGSDLRATLLEEDGTMMAAMQVTVAKTAAGSDSEYLPMAYEPLFHDETLRRPAFTEMKRRMEQRDT